MRTFIQLGNTLTTTAAAAYVSGQGLVLGSLFGVVAGDATIGEPVDLMLEGVFTLPKVSALAIAFGDLLYWDATAKLITKTAGSNKKIGIAASDAANPSANVAVRLVPTI